MSVVLLNFPYLYMDAAEALARAKTLTSRLGPGSTSEEVSDLSRITFSV
jgi:hypothetical protein